MMDWKIHRDKLLNDPKNSPAKRRLLQQIFDEPRFIGSHGMLRVYIAEWVLRGYELGREERPTKVEAALLEALGKDHPGVIA
jgi:hypothetical protein